MLSVVITAILLFPSLLLLGLSFLRERECENESQPLVTNIQTEKMNVKMHRQSY